MPTILRQDGFRFFFYSNEGNEPPHIHVTKGGDEAKFWLTPNVRQEYSYMNSKNTRKAEDIVNINQLTFINSWNEYFGN